MTNPERQASETAEPAATAGPDISVMIVTYNNEVDLQRCLDSVAAALTAGESPGGIEAIVVDNASTDNTVDTARDHPIGARVIEAPGNRGFGAGMNLAASHAAGRHLLLLNPDAALRSGAITELLRVAHDRPDAMLIGGITELADGSVARDEVRRLPSLLAATIFASAISILSSRVWDGERIRIDPDAGPTAVPMVTMSLALIARRHWDRLGGFDERFFMYSEDTALCDAITASGGEVVIAPSARVLHEGGGSFDDTGRRTAMMLAGRATYIRLHWPRAKAATGLALMTLGVALRSAIGRVHPRARRWVTCWQTRSWWRAGYGSERPALPPI